MCSQRFAQSIIHANSIPNPIVATLMRVLATSATAEDAVDAAGMMSDRGVPFQLMSVLCAVVSPAPNPANQTQARKTSIVMRVFVECGCVSAFTLSPLQLHRHVQPARGGLSAALPCNGGHAALHQDRKVSSASFAMIFFLFLHLRSTGRCDSENGEHWLWRRISILLHVCFCSLQFGVGSLLCSLSFFLSQD